MRSLLKLKVLASSQALRYALPFLAGSVLALGCGGENQASTPISVRTLLNLPEHAQEPWVPENNPLTPEKIELGRHLFYDQKLSANQTQSCASCHRPELAFADGKKVSIGSTGDVLDRNSMGLANVAYASTYTWASDGLTSLELQIAIPLVNENPTELGVHDGLREEVLRRFEDDPTYLSLFSAAFPDSDSGPNINKIILALASFCRSLVSFGSAYDQFLAGNRDAMTEQQLLGMSLFFDHRFECFHCHTGINLSNSYRDTNSQDIRRAFFNNGLYNVDGEGSYPSRDQGLANLTGDPNHRGLFRPPILRNVALTAPYMHDGSIETLREVVEHYAGGGRLIESGPHAGDGRMSPLKSTLVPGFQATSAEIDALVAFLESLTDESFINNPKHLAPLPHE